MHALQLPLTIQDEEVIPKIIGGETGLFEVLIRRNNPFLYKTGMSYGFSHHDTEDLMQDAFVAAYENLNKFEHRSSFKTWIIRIMLNLCYKKIHKASFKNEKPVTGDFQLNDEPLFETNSNEDIHRLAINKELNRVIETALLNIPLEYRMVFSLRELMGMNTADTSGALGITETNVKVRLNRAKHMLREKIVAVYSPAEIFEFNLVYCNRITQLVMEKISTPDRTTKKEMLPV
jgi:RNA polymerase sigma factor (sigma-70 family)